MDFALSLAAAGVGALAGVLAGMLGIGGGIVIVPAMVLLLGVGQHAAQGVSLAAIVFTSGVGSLVHIRGGYVQGRVTAIVGPGAALGALLGAEAAHMLDARALRLVFALALLIVGLRMLLVSGGATDE